MTKAHVCYVCGKPEAQCQCDKYCNLCQGEHDVRMVQDGMYYCRECREACDYTPEVTT